MIRKWLHNVNHCMFIISGFQMEKDTSSSDTSISTE